MEQIIVGRPPAAPPGDQVVLGRPSVGLPSEQVVPGRLAPVQSGQVVPDRLPAPGEPIMLGRPREEPEPPATHFRPPSSGLSDPGRIGPVGPARVDGASAGQLSGGGFVEDNPYSGENLDADLFNIPSRQETGGPLNIIYFTFFLFIYRQYLSGALVNRHILGTSMRSLRLAAKVIRILTQVS